MTHPSLFELAQFVDHGAGPDGFEAHVDSCPSCAARLTQLSQRALVARGLERERPSSARSPFRALGLACATGLALLAALGPVSAAAFAPPVVVAPEGVHGVAAEPPAVNAFVTASLAADAGPPGASN